MSMDHTSITKNKRLINMPIQNRKRLKSSNGTSINNYENISNVIKSYLGEYV